MRYFLGYAYSWVVYHRTKTLAGRIMTYVHPPAFLRVNRPYANIKEFYEAFNVKDGINSSDPITLEFKSGDTI